MEKGFTPELLPCAEYATTIQLEQIDTLRHALTCDEKGCQMAARSILNGIEYRLAHPALSKATGGKP
jgi:hypothetical protein